MRSTTVGWLISMCVTRLTQEERTPSDQCWAPCSTTHNATIAKSTPVRNIAQPIHTECRTGARLDPSGSNVIRERLLEKSFKTTIRRQHSFRPHARKWLAPSLLRSMEYEKEHRQGETAECINERRE